MHASLAKLAPLVVEPVVDFTQGQTVFVSAKLDQEPHVRAIVEPVLTAAPIMCRSTTAIRGWDAHG